MKAKYLIVAIQLIKNKHSAAFDVASENCQDLENVAHMDWFEDAVSKRIENDYPKMSFDKLCSIYKIN